MSASITNIDDLTSPALVQSYLTNLLTSAHSIAPSEAQAISSKWQVGTGLDLYTLPSEAFVDIFGAQAGWVLFEEVNRRRSRELQGRDRAKCEECEYSCKSASSCLFRLDLIVSLGKWVGRILVYQFILGMLYWCIEANRVRRVLVVFLGFGFACMAVTVIDGFPFRHKQQGLEAQPQIRAAL